MQRISQSLTGNHALSWLLKMPSIKKKMPSLSINQRSVILPFIDNNNNYLRVDYISESFFNFSQVFKVDGLYERLTDKHLSVRIGIQITKILKYNYMQ